MDKDAWEKLQPLVDRALDLAPGERTLWLARIRAEAPTMADELERLLSREGTLDRRGFLDTPSDVDSLIDKVVGGERTGYQRSQLLEALKPRYTLGPELGRGGMATVYRARDERHGRDVAIKVIRPDAASAVGAERFLTEIRLTANLTHPNILPLLDSGESGGVLYYVMPLVEGESLRARLRAGGALPVEDVVRITRAVAEALSYAHEKGAVHRDIKPDNILMSGRQAWVSDFGIAKAIANSATTAHAVTSVGVALGSPGYMAPEQIEGTGAVDHRADLYSLGAMAWELLAGRPVFDGTTMQQLFTQHLTATPADIATVRPDVPRSVADVVMRCLEKRADDRWPSAAVLVEALDGVVTVSGAHAPASTDRRSRTWAGVGVAAVVGVAAWLGLRDRFTAAPMVLEQLTEYGDARVPAVSPDGRWLAFVRGASRGAIWIRPMGDSGVARRLADAPQGFMSWLDDSTLSFDTPIALVLVSARTGATTRPAWATGRRPLYLGPGRLFDVMRRGADSTTLVLRHLRLHGPGDSLTIQLEKGERLQRAWHDGTTSTLTLLVGMPDSALRLGRYRDGGWVGETRRIAPRDSLGLHEGLRFAAFPTGKGRYLNVRLGTDSLMRVDLADPQRVPERLAFPAGGFYSHPPTPSGDLVVAKSSALTKTWRFPIPGGRDWSGRVVDQVADAMATALAPDGALLAEVRGRVREVVFLRSLAGGPDRTLATFEGPVTMLQWSPDGTRLALRYSVDQGAQRWAVVDVRDGSIVRLGKPPVPKRFGVFDAGFPGAFSPDSRVFYASTFIDDVAPEMRTRRFALVDGDTGVFVTEAITHDIFARRDGRRGERDTLGTNGLLVSPDGKALVTGGFTLHVHPLDGGRMRELFPVDTTLTLVMPIQWRPDGTIIYVTRRNTRLTEVFTINAAGGRPESVGIVPAACVIIFTVMADGTEASCHERELRFDLHVMHNVR